LQPYSCLLATGFAIPTFTETILPFLSGASNASAAWLGGVSAPVLEATIDTDKDDYSPGQVVQISGSGWQPGESVRLEVDYKTVEASFVSTEGEIPHGHDPWFVTADGNGNVASQWLVEEDSRGRTLLLKADGLASGLHAEKTFYDAASIDLEQCHNWSSPNLLNCSDPFANGQTNWGSGAAGSNNARLSEGDNQNFRAIMESVPTGSYTLVLELDITKGGKVAYDRFSSPGRIRTAIKPTGGVKANSNVGVTSPEALGVFPCQEDNDPAALCTPGTADIKQIPLFNGTLMPGSTQFEADAIASQLADVPEHMFLYGGTLTIPANPYTFSGDFATGDSSIQMTMTVSPAVNNGTMVLAWGGHVSRGPDYVLSGKTTATTIQGDPYHMRLISFSALNGDPGNQDMQMAANAIVAPTGSITILKQTNGGFGTFGFTAAPTPSPIPGSFNITTSSGVNPNSQSFANVPNGSYVFTESTLPSGWNLSSINCTISPGGTSSVTPDLPNKRVTINLQGTDAVSCTFTNDGSGHIIVRKETIPDASLGSFDFDAVGGSYADFSLSDGQSNDQGLAAGNYSVSETVPTGWDLTSSPCVSSIGDTETIGALELDAGETITCTFTNTKRGAIKIVKNTVGGNGTFQFNPTGFNANASFNLITVANTANQTFSNIVPGSGYSITETAQTGWDLTSFTCDNGTTAAIVVVAGATTTCTATNTKRSSITINKTAIGGNDTFGYTGSGGAPVGNFNITTVAGSGTQQFDNVPPGGPYTIVENAPPAGWDFSNLVCGAGGSVNLGTRTATITVPAGGNVTCTYTNTKRGAIKIVKNTVGGNGTFQFNPTGFNANASFNLITVANTANQTFSNIVPGSGYSITETAQTGWDLTSFTCDNGTTAAIVVVAGATTTCTATNTKRGSITINKTAIGGNDTFGYTGSGGAPVGNFNITTVAGSGTQQFDNVPPGGPYTIVENAPPAGWDFSNLVCGAGGSVNLGTRTATITVPAGGNVTCTYTNTNAARSRS
jgi:hypothetical protein